MGVTHAAPCLATVGALRVPASIGTAFAALNWPIKACAKPDTRSFLHLARPLQPRRPPPLSPYEAVLCATGAGNRGSSRDAALHIVACQPPHAAVGTEREAWCGGCETSCTRLPGGCETSLQLASRPIPGWQALRVSGPSCRRQLGGIVFGFGAHHLARHRHPDRFGCPYFTLQLHSGCDCSPDL